MHFFFSETKAEFHDEKEDTKCQYKNWGPFAPCSKLETGKFQFIYLYNRAFR